MSQFTIPRRVGLGFALLVLAAIAVGGTSLSRLGAIGGNVERISGNTVPSVVTLSRIIADNLLILQSARTAVLDTDQPERMQAARQDLAAAERRSEEAIATYRGLLSDAEDEQLFGEATAARATFLAEIRRAIELSDRGDPAARSAILGEIIEHNIKLAQAEVAAARSRLETGVAIAATVLGIAALLGILLAAGITRSLSRGLIGVSDALEAGATRTAEAAGQLAAVNRTVAAGCA
jgi:hypothetical protein